MYGHTTRDMVTNEAIRYKVRVASVMDKIRQATLRWFGHVKRKRKDSLVGRCERLSIVSIRRDRDRPKKFWRED